MATSPVSPAASSPPSSNYDMIGAALSEPAEPSQAASPEVTPDPVSEPATEPESTPQSESGEQAEVPADAAAAEPEAENPYEQNPDDDFAPQTLTTILQTPDGKRMYANHKLVREMAKSIGHVPSVDQIKGYYGAYRDQVMMNDDLSSGNPQQAERLLSHLFNPKRGEGSLVVASQLGAALVKANPKAYEAAAEPFITNYGQQLWNRWEQATEPELKKALYQAAQLLHKDFTGEWKTVKDGAATPQSSQSDPLAEGRSELARREEAVTRAEQAGQQAAQQAWTSSLNSKIATDLGSEIDRALAPLKAMHEKAPALYDAMKERFDRLVREGVPKDRHAWDLLTVRLNAARRNGSHDQMDSVVKDYVKMAQQVILVHRKKFLEDAGVAVKQASDARHAELRSIDSHRAVSNGSGSPVKPNTAPVQRKFGESQSDFNLRQLRA